MKDSDAKRNNINEQSIISVEFSTQCAKRIHQIHDISVTNAVRMPDKGGNNLVL